MNCIVSPISRFRGVVTCLCCVLPVPGLLLASSDCLLCSSVFQLLLPYFQLISHLVISFIRISSLLAYEQELQQQHPRALT